MAEDTIPKAIRYKFLERAQRVCDLAKVDYWEHPEILSGLREQMEQSYRTYDAAGLYKDESEARALEDFGSVEAVAKIHRDGWRGLWQRLLYNERYSVHRLVAPVAFCMLHHQLRSSGSLQMHFFEHRSGLRMVVFGWSYYSGIIILLATVVTRRATRFLKWPAEIGKIIAAIIAVWLFLNLATQWLESVRSVLTTDWNGTSILDDTPHWINTLIGTFYLIGYAVEALTYYAVVALAFAEIADFPAWKRSKIETKRKAFG